MAAEKPDAAASLKWRSASRCLPLRSKARPTVQRAYAEPRSAAIVKSRSPSESLGTPLERPSTA
jgi:hypothetical protein